VTGEGRIDRAAERPLRGIVSVIASRGRNPEADEISGLQTDYADNHCDDDRSGGGTKNQAGNENCSGRDDRCGNQHENAEPQAQQRSGGEASEEKREQFCLICHQFDQRTKSQTAVGIADPTVGRHRASFKLGQIRSPGFATAARMLTLRKAGTTACACANSICAQQTVRALRYEIVSFACYAAETYRDPHAVAG
jgi:hypothetical protein